MSTSLLAERIAMRASRFRLVVSDSALSACAIYLHELARWNQRINLTALALEPSIPDAAIDKLVVEPLMATTLLGSAPREWVDLGSGGGSPAIPLRIVWRGGLLTMVESRGRKCAFLRESVRQMGLARTSVCDARIEDFGAERVQAAQEAGADLAQLVTLRAVRIDESMVALLVKLVAPRGFLLTFGSSVVGDAFVREADALLPDESKLSLFRRR